MILDWSPVYDDPVSFVVRVDQLGPFAKVEGPWRASWDASAFVMFGYWDVAVGLVWWSAEPVCLPT